MSIYTGTGDAGTTSLADGSRVPKDHPRVEAYGTVDEANSAVGLARSLADDDLLRAVLLFSQQRLFNISSHLATPPASRTSDTTDVTDDDIAFLERAIDTFEERTGPMDHFIIPGGCQAAGALHVARTVIRRAERRVVALDAECDGDVTAARFLNRLSDVMFAAARYANADADRPDGAWDKAAKAPNLAAHRQV
jgi:cob(I)alamin adenosyltransferase